MFPGVLIGIYYAFLDRVIAMQSLHTLFYKLALTEVIENGSCQSQGLATDTCQRVHLLGPSAYLAITVFNE